MCIVLEKGGKTTQDGGLPMGNELRFEVVLAAKIRLVGGAGQKLKDDFGLELGFKGTSLTTWHGNFSWLGPVFIMLLVQRQGRTTRYCDADYLVINDGIVYAQSTKVLSYFLDPRQVGRALFVPQTYHYFVMVSTKGFYDSIRWLVGAHELAPKSPPGELPHEQESIDISWYVPG
jgi:hypothetical protein